MSILETLASLPQVDSRRVAQDIIAELESRGLRIAEATPADAFLRAWLEPAEPAEVEPIDINERAVWDYDRLFRRAEAALARWDRRGRRL